MTVSNAPVSPELLNLMVDAAAGLGILLAEYQKQQFGVYLAELIKWNKRINLTGITDAKQVVIKHFLDSLAYLKGFGSGDVKIIDIGSGAGFPGLPLKIVKPELQLTLLDARFKRVVFLKELCRRLKLKEIQCLHGRAEELATVSRHHQQYDVAVARALTRLERLISLAFPFIVPGGKLLVSYGSQIDRQLESASGVLDSQGGSLEAVTPVKLPFSNLTRNIVTIKKCST